MMKVLKTKAELRQLRQTWREGGVRVALVPTMGALHEGHLSLVRLAAEKAEKVIVTIYVNPTQFDQAADLETYPRLLEQDLELLRQEGCAAVFVPEQMYTPGASTYVEVHGLDRHLCGATRPGHFRGVTTIVTKLFQLADPDIAVFGEKDFQQVRILEKMVEDLDMRVQIVRGPTVREADGLALSSRNLRLSPEARKQALAIPRLLTRAASAGVSQGQKVGALTQEVRAGLEAAGGQVDYVSVVEPKALELCAESAVVEPGWTLAVAVFFGGVRLIDHIDF